MVLTAYGALSPVTGLSCHRRLQVATCKLDASVGAPGPHVFAVRGQRSRPTHSRLTLPSSTASLPNVRDDRDTPLFSGRDGVSRKFDLPDGESEIFFWKGLDSNFGN
jgi:hypothetical protein